MLSEEGGLLSELPKAMKVLGSCNVIYSCPYKFSEAKLMFWVSRCAISEY